MDTRSPGSPHTATLVDRLVAACSTNGFGPDDARHLLHEALAQRGDWLDERYLRRPPERDWVLQPLHRMADRRCSMLVAVFRPGVRAPVHDHGSWAVIGIYRGRERETWFRRAGGPGPAPLVEMRSFVNETGTVHVVPDGTIHTVEALDAQDAVSIHVYGTDIVTQERRTFDPDTGAEERYQPDFTAPEPARG